MAEKYELAEKDYKKGMKYKDIAEKYSVSINTVKSWKTRKWGKEKSVHTKSKGVHTKSEQREVIESESMPLNEGGNLTDKQWLFCMYYTKYWNATKAYQKAYDSDYRTAMTEGSKNLRKPKIKAEITRMKENIASGILVDQRAVLQKWIDIAFADIGDYIEFDKYSVRMKDLTNVDTSIIAEASNTEDGVKFKLADKMKALDFLSKYTDLLNNNELKQLKVERERVAIDKLNAELSKDDDQAIEIVIKRKGDD